MFARNGALTAVALWLLATAAFATLRVAPGGPYDADHGVRPAVRMALDASFHPDWPALPLYRRAGGEGGEAAWQLAWRPEDLRRTQYVSFLLGCARGDLGPSMHSPDRGVSEVLARGIAASVALCGGALAFALVFGVGLGLAAGARRGGTLDRVIWMTNVIGLGIPGFVMAPLLVLLFSSELGWLPAAGYGSWVHMIMPVVCLGAATSANVCRVARASLLTTLQTEHVLAARARGVAGSALGRHLVARRVAGAVLRRMGPSIALLLSGALAIEMLFQIPGVGHHVVRAAASRDVTLVIGAVLAAAALLVVLDRLRSVVEALLWGGDLGD